MQFEKLTSELRIEPEEKHKIRAQHCENAIDEQNARLEILNSWFDNQESNGEAYILMGEALIRAGLKRIAREVLNYPPATKSSKRPSALLDNEKSSQKRVRTQSQMVVTRC